MPVVHMTADSVHLVVEHRRRTGAGRLDECWEGVWHLTDPSAAHQRLAGQIYRIHAEVVDDARRGSAWISINVTDREFGWLDNHRCPDGAVILGGNPGHWIGERQAAYLGGPDLVVEVLSPGDETSEKPPFYAALGVREILIIDPETRGPQLLRLVSGTYEAVRDTLRSEVTGLDYALTAAGLEIRQPATGRTWTL